MFRRHSRKMTGISNEFAEDSGVSDLIHLQPLLNLNFSRVIGGWVCEYF